MATLRLRDWEKAGIVAVFSRRSGGVSEKPYESLNVGLHVGDQSNAVQTNRERLAAASGIAVERITYAQQVHGSTVTVVGPKDIGRGQLELGDAMPGCDALVTREPDAGLAVLAADCVPLLFADPVAGVIAAAHAGWRGATSGVAANTLAQMTALGARPERIWVAIGPAIRGCCYEVDQPVVTAVEAAYRRFALNLRPPLTRGRSHLHAQIDLPALCKHELLANGVVERHFIDTAICTRCMQGQFSYRGAHGPTGRHAGLIWRREVRRL